MLDKTWNVIYLGLATYGCFIVMGELQGSPAPNPKEAGAAVKRKWLTTDEWKRKHRFSDKPARISTKVQKDRPDYGSSLREQANPARGSQDNPAESLVTAGGDRTSLSTLREGRNNPQIPESHRIAAERFKKLFKEVPLSDSDKLDDYVAGKGSL